MGSSAQIYVYQKKQVIKVSISIGGLKKQLGSSVSCYQVGEKDFWADSEAWELVSKA